MSVIERTMHLRDRRLALSLILMTGLLGATAVTLLSSLTFFSTDTGLRFLQIRALVEKGWQTFAVPYPARLLDPELVHVPYYHAYLVLDNQLYLKVSPYLPLFTSFLYEIFGAAALPTLPVLGGVLTALGTFKLGKLTRVRHPYLLLWFTILATPVLFYSLTLWDHTLGTACAVIATVAVAYGLHSGGRRWFFWGGLAVALGAGQRVEIHLFALAVLASLLLLSWRKWVRWGTFVVGGIAGTIPLWAVQTLWFGHPLGAVLASHVFGYGVPATYLVNAGGTARSPRLVTTSGLLVPVEPPDPVTFLAAVALLIGAFLLVLMLRVPRWRRRTLVISLLLGLVAGYGLFAVIAWQRHIAGLVTVFPPLGLALAFWSQRREKETDHLPYQFVYLATVLFLALMIVLWPAYGGSQWGARYLLPAYPLLLYLAFYTYTRWQTAEKTAKGETFVPPFARTVRHLFVTLLLASVLLQLLSVRILFQRHALEMIRQEAIAALPAELILTNNPFLPPFMTGLDDKIFMYVKFEEDVRRLIPRFQAHGVERFAALTTPNIPLEIPDVDGASINRVAPAIYEFE